MALFIVLLLITNALIAYYCYINAQLKGYPKNTFMILGMIPYLNLAVLVYVLFLPNLKNEHQIEANHIVS